MTVALTEDKTLTSHEIRPFRPEDREAITVFANEGKPEHRHLSVAAWELWDEIREGTDEVYERWCVGATPVAFLTVVDQGTSHWKMEGVCDFDISVASGHRNQGIGAALHEKVLAFAERRGAKRLTTGFSLREGDRTPAIAFLTERGFTEMEREKPSYLPLASFDATPFLPAVDQAERMGLRLVSYAELPDTPENRRRRYDLFATLIHHIPRNDEQPFTIEPFEEWERMMAAMKDFDPRLYWLAEKDGAWVGMTQLMPKPGSRVLMQWLTAVMPEHRGRGLATALKAKAYLAAQAGGYSVVTTENHETNGPMLAVNKKFGFIPEEPHVRYNKVLAAAT